MRSIGSARSESVWLVPERLDELMTRVSTMVDETKHACEECGKLCLAYLSNLKTIRGK